MKKIIGIDFGTKKIGIAISNEDATMAFPVDVVKRVDIIKILKEFRQKEGVKKIVVGESKGFDMSDNPVMVDIRTFVEDLQKEGFEVSYENEFMSSMQASRLQGYNKKQDASAAAIVLQSYLDKQK